MKKIAVALVLVGGGLLLPGICLGTYVVVGSVHRFNLAVNVGQQSLALPPLSAGATKVGASSPLVSMAQSNVSSTNYEFRLGYRIYNPSESFLSRLFSKNSTVELAVSHQGGNAHSLFDHLSSGDTRDTYLWYIDGSGKIESDQPDPQIPPEDTWHVQQVQFQHHFQQNQVRLSLKEGGSYTGPALGFVFQPTFGIIYVDAKMAADSSVQYIGEDMPLSEVDHVHNQIDTYYWGGVFGERIEWRSSSNWIPFANVELFLLRASAKLQATQDPILNPSQPHDPRYTKFAHDSASRPTYRALLVFGVAYRWSHEPDAMRLSLEAGLDHWGYRPGVAMPMSNGEKAHLTSHVATDKFLNLTLSVPLG